MQRRVIVALLACVMSVTALAGSSLSERVAARLAQLLPNFHVTVVDALTLKIEGPDNSGGQANLDRVSQFCAANPDGCDDAMEKYAIGIAETLKARASKPTVDELRAGVRLSTYAANIMAQIGNKPDMTPLVAPLVGDVSIYCFFDEPRTMRIASSGDAKTLGLTPDAAIDLCKKNVETALPPLESEVRTLSGRTFGTLGSNDYESSRLIFHDDWAPVATRMNGNLIVSVPASNLTLYGEEVDAAALDAVATLTKQEYERAERPISLEVFRWTPKGWEVAAH